MSNQYVGLMSGTSLDGVDCVLASFGTGRAVEVHHSVFIPFPLETRSALVELLNDPNPSETSAEPLHQCLGEIYAQAVLEVIDGQPTRQIQAVGCHGQTILHKPDADPPSTWQIGDGSVIADATGLPVVVDFRSADMRVGGQGAPFAPFFHNYAFRSNARSRAIVNIGGIANVTYLSCDPDRPVTGFDTGPGNALSDQWIRKIRNLPYDHSGRWAMSADVNAELLACFLDDPYFNQPIPKSLDSRRFSLKWLEKKLKKFNRTVDPAEVQASIAALTAESIWLGIRQWMADVEEIYFCGGGTYNQAIVHHLETISGLRVSSTVDLGVPPNLVEACLFAWLAECRMKRVPASIPSVTGASENAVLGTVLLPIEP